jgi:hypothetical protein
MKMDDRATCARCGGTAHDLVSHAKGEMTLQCCYCLEFVNVFGYPPASQESVRDPGGYVLKHGRYKGQSIKSVADLGQRGVEYLKLLARDSQKMNGIISEYFESRSAVSVQAASDQHQPEPHRSPSRDEASISGSQ